MSIEIEKFEVISNLERQVVKTLRPQKTNPVVARLLNDETLFVKKGEISDTSLNHFYAVMRKNGFKLNKYQVERNNVLGFMLWAEKKEEV